MSRPLAVSLAALAVMIVAAPLSAQTRSTVDLNTLDAAVSTRPVNHRAIVASALSSKGAYAAAARMGLSAEELTARIEALDDVTAKRAADQLLAGGDGTIVISTTAVIIGLLLLILLTR
jgi:biopolymer transport protein ExbD